MNKSLAVLLGSMLALLPNDRSVRAETFSDVVELTRQLAKANCAAELATHIAITPNGKLSFDAVLDSVQANGSSQPWPGAWPPSEVAVKTIAVSIYQATEWGADFGTIHQFVRQRSWQAVPAEVQEAAIRLAKNAGLYICLGPNEEELADAFKFVDETPGGNVVEFYSVYCFALSVPQMSEILLSNLPSGEMVEKIQAIDAEQIACNRKR